jgi:hypothetical protein
MVDTDTEWDLDDVVTLADGGPPLLHFVALAEAYLNSAHNWAGQAFRANADARVDEYVAMCNLRITEGQKALAELRRKLQ